MIKTEKTRITEIFKELEKFGYKVFTFNSNKAVPKGTRDFVDHLIIGHGRVIFVEVKIGKDTMSAGQEQTHALLGRAVAQNKLVESFVIKEAVHAAAIRERIIQAKDGALLQ